MKAIEDQVLGILTSEPMSRNDLTYAVINNLRIKYENFHNAIKLIDQTITDMHTLGLIDHVKGKGGGFILK